MKLGELYKLAIRFGRQHDPRKKKNITGYSDSVILYGDPNTKVKKVMVGIDIESAEVILADRIRQEKGLDLILSHHPEGRGYALLHQVMALQVDLLKKAGIPSEVARKLLEERMWEVERKILAQNHMRAVDTARFLKIPFISLHTPADNHVFVFLRNLFNRQKPQRLSDILEILFKIPEYQYTKRTTGLGPVILLGSPKRKVGKILFEMTGGTEGPKKALDKLYKAGVRTLVSMHLSEEHFKKASEVGLNVVIAGHISRDTLGLNLLLDRIEEKESLDIIECSGFKRIRRI